MFLPMTCTGYEMYSSAELVETMLTVKSPPMINRYFMLMGLAGYFLMTPMT
jgi:hypothetical protein